MKIIKVSILVGSILLLFNSCEKTSDLPEPEPMKIELSTKAAGLILSGNDFGIDLFVRSASDESGNFMLSPLSANVALTMALNGADGNTLTELKKVLGYPENMTTQEINQTYKSLVEQLLNADKKVKLAIANALFFRNGFAIKQPFINTLTNNFNVQVEGLDFNLLSAVTAINKWASDNTNGKIPKVIDQISPDMVMFLMNALYFKGDWSYQFDKSKTQKLPFRLENGSIVTPETMTGKVGAIIHRSLNYSAIELPYGRKNFSMVVVVPDGTLKDFYSDFNSTDWREITSALDSQNTWGQITVVMPKFKFSFEKILNRPFREMGMTDAFTPYVANFKPITDQDIFIGFVKQNTFVDVNEEGTEAAAVTTIGFETTSIGPSNPTFVIDKPIVFAIRERTTNTLMFIGSVVNP